MSADGPSSSTDRAWDAFGVGLGRLLGSLADLDLVRFEIDDAVVLTPGRDAHDLWLLAIGPEATVNPVDLSDDQLATLATLGFHPPIGEEAERAPQRETWWFRLRLPADPAVLESAGHMLAAAARQVYGAERPSDIQWSGTALGESTQAVLDSLENVKHEAWRD